MNRKAFTLIELLIVVVIISLVLLVAVPAFRNARTENAHSDAMSRLVDLGTGARNYAIDRMGGHVRSLGELTDMWLTEGGIRRTEAECVPHSAYDTIADYTVVDQLFACGYAKSFYEGARTGADGTIVTYNGYKYAFCGTNAPTDTTTCCAQGYDESLGQQYIVTMAAVTTEDGKRYHDPAACAWVDMEGKVGNNYELDMPL